MIASVGHFSIVYRSEILICRPLTPCRLPCCGRKRSAIFAPLRHLLPDVHDVVVRQHLFQDTSNRQPSPSLYSSALADRKASDWYLSRRLLRSLTAVQPWKRIRFHGEECSSTRHLPIPYWGVWGILTRRLLNFLVAATGAASFALRMPCGQRVVAAGFRVLHEDVTAADTLVGNALHFLTFWEAMCSLRRFT